MRRTAKILTSLLLAYAILAGDDAGDVSFNRS